CLDDANIQMIIPRITRRIVTYGMRAQAEISASDVQVSRENFGSEFTVRHKGEDLGRIKLNVPRAHNVCNALGAVAVGLELKVDFAKIAEGLEGFAGVGRRFEVRGLTPAECGGILVVDDYGHHPTEIGATLAAAKTSGRRLVVLFQPHRYTRTAA